MSTTDSYFDGGLLGLLGTFIVSLLITVLTFGIGFPWALCYKQRWFCKHSVIEGNRLRFDGTGMGLFGIWIKIFLLSIITLGIYGLWAGITVKKWELAHTRFE